MVAEVSELGNVADMGFLSYVDDGVAKMVGGQGTGIAGLCDKSKQFDEIFGKKLAEHNYTANPSKNESVMSIFGEDSQRHLRAVINGEVKPAGKVCAEARCLGGRLHGLLDMKGEVAIRAFTPWASSSSRWASLGER